MATYPNWYDEAIAAGKRHPSSPKMGSVTMGVRDQHSSPAINRRTAQREFHYSVRQAEWERGGWSYEMGQMGPNERRLAPAYETISGTQVSGGFKYGRALTESVETARRLSTFGLKRGGIREAAPGLNMVEQIVSAGQKRHSAIDIGVRFTGSGKRLGAQIMVGGDVIDLPFEFRQGMATRRSKLYGARAHITEANKTLSFSEYAGAQIAQAVRDTESDSTVVRDIKKTLTRLGQQGYYTSESYLGRDLMSRAEKDAQAVIFHEQHPLSNRLRGVRDQLVEMQKVAGSDLPRAERMMQRIIGTPDSPGSYPRLLSDIKGEGYEIMGMKHEHLFSRKKYGRDVQGARLGERGPAEYIREIDDLQVMALRRHNIMAGIKWANQEKGIHQVWQREQVTPGMARRLGAKRSMPWLGATGVKRNYELPVSIGYMESEWGTRVMGDAQILLGSQKSVKFAGEFPEARVLDLHVASKVTPQGTIELERRSSRWFNELLGRKDVRTALNQGRAWTAEDLPHGIYEPSSSKRVRRKGMYIGQNTGYVGRSSLTSAISTGEDVFLEKGFGIKSIRRLETSQGVKYEMGIARRRGTASIGRLGFLLPGAQRASAGGSVRLGGIDVLARIGELKTPFARDTTFVNHWFEIASDIAKSEADRKHIHGKLAGKLGLIPEVRNGKVMVYTGNNYFQVTQESAAKAHQYLLQAAHTRGGDAGKRAMRSRFFGDRRHFTHREATQVAEWAGWSDGKGNLTKTGKQFVERFTKHEKLRVFRGSPFTARSGVSAGLPAQRGMRLRLEHYWSMMARIGGSASTDADYLAHANAIKNLIESKNPGLMQEAKNIYGPMFEGFAKGPTGQVVGLGKYKELFNTPVPSSLRGGVQLADIATSAMGHKTGAWVELPGEIMQWMGNPESIGALTEPEWYSTRRIWMPSQELLGAGVAPGGKVFGDKTAMAALRRLDEQLRATNPDLKTIELEYNRLTSRLRSKMWGKKGMLASGARPSGGGFGSMTSRLVHLPVDDAGLNALDIHMTEKRLRSVLLDSGVGHRRAKRIIRSVAKGGDFFMSGGVEPMMFSGHYVPAMRVRLMKNKDMIRHIMQSGVSANMDDAVRVGEAIVTIGERDFDLDVFYNWVNVSADSQKRLARMHSRDQAYFQFAHETAVQYQGGGQGRVNFKSFPKESELAHLRNQADDVNKWVEFARTKFATPVPELFYRTRGELATMLTPAASGDLLPENIDKLKRMGLGDLVGKTGTQLTHNQSSALHAVAAMTQQQFLGKGRERSFGVMVAGLSVAQGNPAKAKQLNVLIREHMLDILKTKREKFRLPQFGGQIINDMMKAGMPDEEIVAMVADEATAALQKIEPILSQQRVDPFYAAERGMNMSKSKSQITRMLYETSMEGESDSERMLKLRQLMGNPTSKEVTTDGLRAINEQIKASADFKGSSKAFMNSAGAVIRKVWGKGWAGKAAVIGVAGAGVLGLRSAFGGPDAVAPTDAVTQPQMGMPEFPHMGDLYAAIGQTPVMGPNPGALPKPQGIAGEIHFDGPVSIEQEAIVGNLLGESSGYGYNVYNNLPVSDHNMEQYIRDKARSDF